MKRLFTACVFLLIIVLALILWWKNGLMPVNAKDQTQQIFVIEKGDGIRTIANKLKRNNLIRDPVVFFLLLKQQGLDNKIQAGDFRLSPSMSASEITQALVNGRLDVWVTIPEGKRGEEIAEILKSNIPAYNDTWVQQLSEHEGYLFPDTYLIPKDATINLIISVMRKNFDDKYATLSDGNENLDNKEQVVTIASLIEREAKLPEDRPLVASVIYNRLDIDMALQIDATVQYALGYQEGEKNWWKKKLTRSDLKIDSLYNTYLYPGLPPGPIANPGLAALTAAIKPAKTNFRYYISDKSGMNHYAITIEEHNANIKKYGL